MTDPTIATLSPADVVDPYHLGENIEQGQKTHDRIPEHFRNATVDVDEVAAWVQAVVALAAEEGRTVPRVLHGPSLLLAGPTGTGKTYQAFGAIRALTVSGAACSWLAITAADCYARLRPRHRVDAEAEFQAISNAGLLLLDDLGAAKSSEWNEEVNYRLINYRYEHEKPTIITSNVAPKYLGAALGDRVSSRLSEMATRVVLKGTDRRLTAAPGSAA